MFKIYDNLVPQYLKGISPNIRGNLRAYDTRNSNENAIPRCRLEVYKKNHLFLIQWGWKSLSLEIMEVTSIDK